MENPSTFPLFNLPLVATEHVLSMFNPFELIDLSLTSIRARKFVSYFYKFKVHEKFRVSLRIVERPLIAFHGLRTTYVFKLTSDNSKEGFEEIYDTSNTLNRHLYKYSEDVIDGLMEYYENLKEVFGCNIGTFNIDTGIFENRPIIDWLKKQQKAIDQVFISNYKNVRDDDIKYFLSNIKVSKAFSMNLYIAHGIGFQLDSYEDLDYLYISSSKFLTLENLLKLKSRKIHLMNSSLTSRELNIFLKSWMSCTSHLNLETFHVNISSREAMTEILDLPHEEKSDPDLVANLREKFHWISDVNVVCDVKRSDGKVATVCLLQFFIDTYYYGRMHLIIR